jgi:epoxyqueuosine reductase
MFVDAPLEGDGPMADFCGRCTRCLTGCPTGAFLSPRRLDAGRCISYWTIEARELAPPELLPAFGRWIFGCDLCQEVCPHNHRPDPADEDDLLPRNAWLDLDELIATPDDALEAQYTGTPLRRPGARGLKRNALVALGNIGDPGAEHSITLGLNHPDGMVRDAAAWAAARLAGDTLRARR